MGGGRRFELPSLEACTANYIELWQANDDEFSDEEWMVIRPDGKYLYEFNLPYKHEDGEEYCEASDVKWIDEEERQEIVARFSEVAPAPPPMRGVDKR